MPSYHIFHGSGRAPIFSEQEHGPGTLQDRLNVCSPCRRACATLPATAPDITHQKRHHGVRYGGGSSGSSSEVSGVAHSCPFSLRYGSRKTRTRSCGEFQIRSTSGIPACSSRAFLSPTPAHHVMRLEHLLERAVPQGEIELLLEQLAQGEPDLVEVLRDADLAARDPREEGLCAALVGVANLHGRGLKSGDGRTGSGSGRRFYARLAHSLIVSQQRICCLHERAPRPGYPQRAHRAALTARPPPPTRRKSRPRLPGSATTPTPSFKEIRESRPPGSPQPAAWLSPPRLLRTSLALCSH